MINRQFTAAISVSLFCHALIFSGIVEVTFNNGFRPGPPLRADFLGNILSPSDFSGNSHSQQVVKQPLNFHLKTGVLAKIEEAKPHAFAVSKPNSNGYLDIAKGTFLKKAEPININQGSSAAVMFYPHLPRNFLIYFKDRQKIHLELSFFTTPSSSIKSIKRTVSSGNLEADLLALRYITHWLYLQQYNFSPNTWQSVKIDLEVND